MKKPAKTDNDQQKPFIFNVINSIVNGFLAISLLAFFITGIRMIFGDSEGAIYSSYIFGTVFAGIAYRIIQHSFTGVVILLLFAFPAIALALTFMLI